MGSFPKSKRLLGRAEFTRVQRDGFSSRSKHATVLVQARADDLPARLGVVASKRLGNAVLRNRAKRRIREWFRRQQVPNGIDLVVIPRTSVCAAPQGELWDSLNTALDKGIAKACRRARPASS